MLPYGSNAPDQLHSSRKAQSSRWADPAWGAAERAH